MHQLRRFATLVLLATTTIPAQSPLLLGQPLTSPNQGNPDGAVYFDMTVSTTITWSSLTYVCSDVSPAGSSACNVYVGPATWVNNVSSNPGPWSLVATTIPVAITGGLDETVIGVLQPAGVNPGTLTFAPGTYGVALEAIGHSWGYQNGTMAFSTAEMAIVTGGASNALLTPPTFASRTINGQIDYTLGGTPFSLPSATAYGSGCYARYQTFYEFFANPSIGFDLSNTSMRLQYDPATNTYAVDFGLATPVATSATPLVFAGNNADVTVQLQNMQPLRWAGVGGMATSPFDPVSGSYVCDVSADGFVSFLPASNPPPALNNPSTAAFLAGGARFGTWHDMDVLAGGAIVYDYDPALQAHVFSWNGVPSRGIAGANTFQLLFFANGDIETRWGVMNLAVGSAWPTLVGFTPGGGALDPGPADLGSGQPFATDPDDTLPLTLTANANPVLGTTILLTTSNETSQPGVGATFLSLTAVTPALGLASLGMPGCDLHLATLQVGVIIDNIPSNGMTVPVTIPNVPALIGTTFYGQSIWFDATQNAFGALTSNGLRLVIG